jgi:hypothetical protein
MTQDQGRCIAWLAGLPHEGDFPPPNVHLHDHPPQLHSQPTLKRKRIDSAIDNDSSVDNGEGGGASGREEITAKRVRRPSANTSLAADSSSSKRSRSSLSSAAFSATPSRASGASSPTKNAALTEHILRARHKVAFLDFGYAALKHVSEDIYVLLKNVFAASTGYRTVPVAAKNDLARQDPWTPWNTVQDWYYDTPADSSYVDPTFHQAHSLVSIAQNFGTTKPHEDAWNATLHHPILDLAVSLSRHRDRIFLRPITHVPVLPRLLTYQQGIRRCKVDYGLFLRDSDPLHEAWTHLPSEQDGLMTWNHTNDVPNSETPLVISIETKRDGGDSSIGEVQLIIWARSHLRRLAELRTLSLQGLSSDSTPDTSIWLPLLSVVGSSFYLILARGDVR